MSAPSISVLLPIIATEPWQVHMTRCAINTMIDTTKINFELNVVETVSQQIAFHQMSDYYIGRDYPVKFNYLHRPERTSQVLDLNAGLDMCNGDFIVYTGNDVFMRPDWLEALLECFEFPDCGIACLGMSELGHKPEERITEGFSGPLMMFKREWRFDEAFPEVFIDADLCMRVYKSGLRSYRNYRVVVQHLLSQTSAAIDDAPTRKRRFDEGRAAFIARHRDSPLMMYRYLAEGHVI